MGAYIGRNWKFLSPERLAVCGGDGGAEGKGDCDSSSKGISGTNLNRELDSGDDGCGDDGCGGGGGGGSDGAVAGNGFGCGVS